MRPKPTNLNLTNIPVIGDEFSLGGDLRFYPLGSKPLFNPYVNLDVGLVANSLNPFFGGGVGFDWVFVPAFKTPQAFGIHGVNVSASWNNVKNFSFGLNYTLKGFQKR